MQGVIDHVRARYGRFEGWARRMGLSERDLRGLSDRFVVAAVE
jgi:hypothetical protein